MRPFIQPGAPDQTPPATQVYRPPVGTLQDSGRQSALRQPDPPPATEVEPPPPLAAGGQDDPRRAMLAEWRAHHGSDWVRADALAPEVRRLIDPKDRTAAIRQKLRGLASTPIGGFRLEAKTVGNRAKPVMFYRVTESEPAGLEG